MIEIRCFNDITKLKGGEVKNIVTSRFNEAIKGIFPNSSRSEDLTEHGKFLVLQGHSDLQELNRFCLSEGITEGIPPEAIEIHSTGKTRLFELLFLANNQYIYQIFIPEWIAEKVAGWDKFLERYENPKQLSV
ncbi:MAG: hypothetical protein HQM09_08715 [Candidatus Riflebacteria bacterium]|nr:hypothetical protein [Candidatus Riflebacteria bacterium]